MLAGLASWWRDRRKRRELPKRSLRVCKEGFSILREGGPTTDVRWVDVVEVIAWKRDLFTVDQICLGFRLKGHTEVVMINEDEVGWRPVLSSFKEAFPSLPPKWYGDVMQPPFALKWATIWGEPTDPDQTKVLWH